MPNDIVTFHMDGEITNEKFALAVRRFVDLVAALTNEFAAEGEIRWVLSNLDAGSLTATSQGIAAAPADLPKVERVASAYLDVGQRLASNVALPYALPVQQPATLLKSMLNPQNRSIRFENYDNDVTIEESADKVIRVVTEAGAYGAVQGRVQTLTSRGALRFTLYDLLRDRAISCYLAEGREDIMRDAWGRIATVEGWVKRDRESGRPLTVRQISSVTILPEPDGSYRDARGASPRDADDQESAEGLIRRLRDAG